MTEWRGSGLPASARERISRASQAGFHTSHLSVAGHLAVEACGLEPIGYVIGCTADRLDWGEFGLGEVGCGYVPPRALKGGNANTVRSAGKAAGPVVVGARLRPQLTGQAPLASRDDVANGGVVVYRAAAYSAWERVLERMITEAKGLDADGVVGVELAEERHRGDVRQFVTTGTAVRFRENRRNAELFTTTLSGGDVAKLLAGGWSPVSVALGLSVAIRHDTFRNRLSRTKFSAVREVGPITQLVQAARAHACAQVKSAGVAVGADGVILTSQLTLSIEEKAVNPTHHDLMAECRAVGSTIVEGGAPSRSPSLTVIPLKG